MTRRALALAGWVVAVVSFGPKDVVGQQGTSQVAERYLELTLSREYDALLDLYAPDAVFRDPTGDVFPGPIGVGVTGADSIVAVQKRWGLAGADFDVTGKFAVGPLALYHGVFKVRYHPSDPWTSIPFVTVLRVEDGRVTRRTDFGEYIQSFQMGDRFEDATRSTREVAKRYLQAYLDADLVTQAELLAPDAEFQDETAQVYGPNSGQLLVGRDEIIKRRRGTFQNVSAFGLDVADSFVANHHAVFIGTTTYTLSNGTRYAQPAVFVVEVRDGHVTRHWDFVDYTVGPLG